VALPPGITPKTVTIGIGSFFDGTIVAGSATITAPVNVLHTPSGHTLYSGDMTKQFVDGEATWTLCPTDAAGLNRVDWTYKLRVTAKGAATQPNVIYFTLPEAGPDTVDLDGLVTVPSSAGTPVAVDVLTTGELDPLTAGFVSDESSQTAVALRAAYVPRDEYTASGATDALHIVSYSGGAYPARPAGVPAGQVRYIGPVQPTDWLTNDEWVNNS